LLSTAGAAEAAAKVVINEVHYHPADDARTGELVELLNHGVADADLTGWVLLGGVDYAFPAGTVLPAGGFLVVAADPAETRARYGLDASLVKGPFSGALDNDGDRLELWTADGDLMSFVDYGDSDPWPETPDGLGPSLERIYPIAVLGYLFLGGRRPAAPYPGCGLGEAEADAALGCAVTAGC
jgi:hypothetical protein